jgi:hypothetical protein
VVVTGETVIEIRCAPTTVKVVESLSEPTLAVIAVVPEATRVASPVLSIVATTVDEELHVTPLVRS